MACWFIGLLVYAVWFISIGVQDKNNWLKIKSYLPLVYSFAITLLVFLPWQIFILQAYPLEAQFEFDYNTRHFFEVIEKHGGDIWFHFDAIKVLYGSDIFWILIVIGLIILLKNTTNRIYAFAIFSAIVITYSFYSLAATKMVTFCIIVSPFAYLAIAAVFDFVFKFLNTKLKSQRGIYYIKSIAILFMGFSLLSLNRIQNYHTHWKPYDNCHRSDDEKQMEFINLLQEAIGNEQHVVFNADIRFCGEISVMFYTDHIAYDFIPTQQQIDTVKMQFYKIAIYDNDKLPDYIMNDEDIMKVKNL